MCNAEEGTFEVFRPEGSNIVVIDHLTRLTAGCGDVEIRMSGAEPLKPSLGRQRCFQFPCVFAASHEIPMAICAQQAGFFADKLTELEAGKELLASGEHQEYLGEVERLNRVYCETLADNRFKADMQVRLLNIDFHAYFVFVARA